MNTISGELLDELSDAIDRLDADDDVRAILLSGAGDRAFSAGRRRAEHGGRRRRPDHRGRTLAAGPADVRQARKSRTSRSSPPSTVTVSAAGWSSRPRRISGRLRALGARPAGAQPRAAPGVGRHPAARPHRRRGRAKKIIFTADRYEAETLADYGFINEVVPDDELDERARELVESLAAGPPIAQKYTKRAMHAGRTDAPALEVEAMGFGHVMNTDDLMEGVTAFMGDGEPEFEGK